MRRYHDLQHAHMSQAKLVHDAESHATKIAVYRNTIKTQEEVGVWSTAGPAESSEQPAAGWAASDVMKGTNEGLTE